MCLVRICLRHSLRMVSVRCDAVVYLYGYQCFRGTCCLYLHFVPRHKQTNKKVTLLVWYLALWEPQIWTHFPVLCTSVIWLKSKMCMHCMPGVVQGPCFIWQMYITFRYFPTVLLRSYESESTGNDKRYLSNKTRNLYLTTCVQFKMLCLKQYRFLRYEFCHSVEGQAEKQYSVNSYLRSKVAESVKLLTGIRDLSESVLDKDNDCPDRLRVIILTTSRQVLAYYPKYDH